MTEELKTKENPLIKHFIEFGKEIKKNGELVKSEENRSMYRWDVGRYQYVFDMTEKRGVPIYILHVLITLPDNKRICIPVFQIHFTDRMILNALSNKDISRLAKKKKELENNE